MLFNTLIRFNKCVCVRPTCFVKLWYICNNIAAVTFQSWVIINWVRLHFYGPWPSIFNTMSGILFSPNYQHCTLHGLICMNLQSAPLPCLRYKHCTWYENSKPRSKAQLKVRKTATCHCAARASLCNTTNTVDVFEFDFLLNENTIVV